MHTTSRYPWETVFELWFTSLPNNNVEVTRYHSSDLIHLSMWFVVFICLFILCYVGGCCSRGEICKGFETNYWKHKFFLTYLPLPIFVLINFKLLCHENGNILDSEALDSKTTEV